MGLVSEAAPPTINILLWPVWLESTLFSLNIFTRCVVQHLGLSENSQGVFSALGVLRSILRVSRFLGGYPKFLGDPMELLCGTSSILLFHSERGFNFQSIWSYFGYVNLARNVLGSVIPAFQSPEEKCLNGFTYIYITFSPAVCLVDAIFNLFYRGIENNIVAIEKCFCKYYSDSWLPTYFVA